MISALDGTGGVGKTTLAIHWAHGVQDRFPDGTLYANLRGYGPSEPATPTEVLDSFLRALGCAPEGIPAGPEAQAGLYRSLLAGRRVLIVLDNANAASQVRPLLPGTAGCLALITSRASLTGLVISESAIRVTLDLLTPQESIDLIRGIIGPARADAEPEAISQLTQLCARLPLALRVAAHRAAACQHNQIADLVTELSDRQTRLDHLTVPGDELATVRSVLSWSNRALPSDQSRMFRLLALHPGPHISAEAAAALADISPPQARHLLDALADIHLVDHIPNDRYTFHDLLRGYANEQTHQIDTPGHRNTAVYRLLAWYLHTMKTIDRQLAPSIQIRIDATTPPHYPIVMTTQAQAIHWLKIEIHNILTMMRLATAMNMHALTWQLTAACMATHVMPTFIPLEKQAFLYRTGLAAARQIGDRYGEYWMLSTWGENFELLQKFTESIDYQRQALAIAREINYRHGEAFALSSIGDGLSKLGRHAESIPFHRLALTILKREGNMWAIGVGLVALGDAYRRLRRFHLAGNCYTEAEEKFDNTNDRFRRSSLWEGRGAIAIELGQYKNAIEFYNRALTLNREGGYRYFEVGALIGLGSAWSLAGNLDEARNYWQYALTVCESCHDHRADEMRIRLKELM